MAVPVISNLPPAPTRSDAPADFTPKADAMIGALQPMVVQINTSLTWIATQVNAAEGYAVTASQAASAAGNSAAAADASRIAAQSAAAAAGSAIGLPSLIGNGRRALAVLPNESGVSFQSQIKALYIEPLLKANATGAYVLNVGASGTFDLALTGNTTISFTSLPTLSASEMIVVLLRASNGGTAYSLTLPAGIIWITSGGIAPAAPAINKKVEIVLTFEGGSIYGRLGGGT